MARNHEFGTHHLSSVSQSVKKVSRKIIPSKLLDNSVGSMQ